MKVLVSSCLLGENVRYDGNNSFVPYNSSLSFLEKELFMDLLCENEIYSFCPELSGGLSTPRSSAEIISLNKPFKVQTHNNKDVSINFLLGAKNTLTLCKKEGISVAFLKSKSPSCGNEQIYDGTFSSKLIKAEGLTAKLLLQNGIKVFNETQIKQLNKFLKE